MLRLKTISLLGHPGELDTLPEGKLLINTINAHSYNTARKDAAFAEALLKGDALIPDGASIVLAFKLLRHEKIERIAGWDLFQYEMKKTERERRYLLLFGQQRRYFTENKGQSRRIVSQYPDRNLFPTL
mgnify:CR=1 FL=1